MSLFSEDLIFVHPQCLDKDHCLKKMVTFLEERGYIDASKDFLQKVMEREEAMSTGIGYGIAIPHGRSKSVHDLKILVYILDKAIDFESIDRQPVRIIFLFAIPEEGKEKYMPVLGAVSQFLRNSDNRNNLTSATSPSEVLLLLQEIKIGSN